MVEVRVLVDDNLGNGVGETAVVVVRVVAVDKGELAVFADIHEVARLQQHRFVVIRHAEYLERFFHCNAVGDVDKNAVGEEGCVCRKETVVDGSCLSEHLLHQLGVFVQSFAQAADYHAVGETFQSVGLIISVADGEFGGVEVGDVAAERGLPRVVGQGGGELVVHKVVEIHVAPQLVFAESETVFGKEIGGLPLQCCKALLTVAGGQCRCFAEYQFGGGHGYLAEFSSSSLIQA